MTIMKSVHKAQSSRLVQLFGGRLKDWAEELQKSKGSIVAISRKAPRLLELMVREGLLAESILSRVIAEQALPFLTKNDNSGFVVIDDTMTFGTTFDRIYNLTKQANIRCGGDDSDLVGVPFAVGKEANAKFRRLAEKHFLDLESHQIAPFVNNEMLAFRLLGKPYDIEHPMLTWIGDFTDTYKLEAAIEQITELLGGQKFHIDTSVPTATGNVLIRRWTILLSADSYNSSYPHTDYKKLRIYLNPERDRLLVAAMSPLSLSKTDMESFGENLPALLNQLWREVIEKIDTKTVEQMAIANDCSLAMWANYLFATVLLRDIKAKFVEGFETMMPQPQMRGPCREDLQYLIGTDLCYRAESILAQFLEHEIPTPVSFPLFDHAYEVLGERIPQRYEANYINNRSTFIDKALDANDVLQAVFHTQHTHVELLSRDDNRDIDAEDISRLEFGTTYNKLRQLVLDKFPDTTEIDIHKCLDKLIDNGAVVPRYINMSFPNRPAIWVRTFRVGEGTVQRIVNTVRLLFETLSAAQEQQKDIPPLLFEKFCVLALCVAKDMFALRPLESLEIEKKFHLYGARPALLQGKEKKFLMEWAVEQKILSRSTSDLRHIGTEQEGNYNLQQNIEELYPKRDGLLDDKVEDGLKDLARLVVEINKKYGSSMLVTLTSVASKQELQHAIEAELNLWLYDPSFSIYKGLAKLKWLAEMDKYTPTEAQLNDVNNILSKMANFTAQVNEKIKLEENIRNTYSKIDELVATDELMRRCWRDLRVTLDGRIISEAAAPGLQEIISTLRIIHVTNRILRELLSLAGFIDERSIGLTESLNRLQTLLDTRERVDHVTRTMFAATESESDISTLITNTKNQPLDDFRKAFPVIHKLVLEIADRCERILKVHGFNPHIEQSRLLTPPRYIIMWDIIGSTSHGNRDKIEALITEVNRRIDKTFGKRILDFHSDSKDDGNGFICEHFTDVLTAFQLLNEVFQDFPFRAGCDANLQGQLNYYPESKSLGGRAYEHAARTMAFFKEIKIYPDLWIGTSIPPEPTVSYMIVSEFAKRYAQQQQAWSGSETFSISDLDGVYQARIHASLPVSLAIIQSIACK